MAWDWECEVCGEWADNRLMMGSPQTYWYSRWFCDEHCDESVMEYCERQGG